MPQEKAQSDAFNLFRRLGINPTRQHLLEVLDGASYDAFLFLDEKPGLFDGNYLQHAWHRLMRIERNDPNSPLLDGLRRGDTEMRGDVLPCGCPRQIVIDEGHQEGCDIYEDQRVIDAELAAENRVDGPETIEGYDAKGQPIFSLDDTDAINETLRDLGTGTEI